MEELYHLLTITHMVTEYILNIYKPPIQITEDRNMQKNF